MSKYSDKLKQTMISKLTAPGAVSAERSFNNANQVEEIHASLYGNVLKNLGKNESVVYYVCRDGLKKDRI